MKHNLYLFIVLIFCVLQVTAQQLITPSQAIKLALEHNYQILISENLSQVAANNTTLLNSGYLPSLNANAGAAYNLDDTEAEFSNGDVRNLSGAKSSRYHAGIQLNFLLFDGLGRAYNFKKLQEQHQLTKLQAKETIENTVLQLFSAYYTIAQLKETKDALAQNLAISEERWKSSNRQFKYGQNTKLATLNAEVDVNKDRILLSNTTQQLQNAKRNLNVITGNKLPKLYQVDTLVTLQNLLNKQTLFLKAKEKNISLLKSKKNISLKQLDLRLMYAEFFPKLSVNGSYGWNKNNNNAASFLSTSTNIGLSGGISLTWNLFEGKAFVAAKNRKLSLQNEQLQQKQLVLNVENQFNNAWEDYLNKYKIYQLQEHNIITAQNNFNRTQEKFLLGQVNSIEFRQAQLNLTDAKIQKNQAKYQTKLAELQVLYLSGEILNFPH